jgi:hypothetical protein
MVNQFAIDFEIAKAISDGNLNEDLCFHSSLNRWKADRNEENRR